MAASVTTEPGKRGKAPGPGHNGLDQDTFLLFVNKITAEKTKVEAAQLLYKKVRKEAKAAGIELGQLDAIVRMSEWSMEEVREHFGIQTRYALWLELPVGAQANLFAEANESPVKEGHGAEYWSGKGFAAGVKGLPGTPPDECHPQHHQDFIHGWGKGQAKLAPKKLETVN